MRENADLTTAAEMFARAQALDLAGQETDARQAYLDVLARDMAHAGALNNLGALLKAAGYRGAARLAWQQALERCPGDPRAYVNLRNLLRESGEPGARALYEAALHCDPALPEAHQGMAHLLTDLGDAAAAWHQEQGFAPRPLSTAPFRGAGRPVTVLQLVSCIGGNIPTRSLLPDRMFHTHTLFVEYAARLAALPPHDIVFNAIGDADLCRPALLAADALLRGGGMPVLNPPRAVLATGRAGNAARLGRLAGVIAPRIATLPRALLAGADAAAALARHGLVFPLLLRAPGFHTGRHFVKAERAEDLPAHVASLPGDTLMAIQYLSAHGDDGAFRKYRAMLVGGRILPLHLAVADRWMVHYYTADMTDRADHRAEEAAYLTNMAGVLGGTAMRALAAIGETLALDYAGVDFALTPDGRLLLFEANATMVVAPPFQEPRWAYRRAAVTDVLDAVRTVVSAGAAAHSRIGWF
jgi:glutathione synthase/RimK-type ligase-like ATP-grasp enzyme